VKKGELLTHPVCEFYSLTIFLAAQIFDKYLGDREGGEGVLPCSMLNLFDIEKESIFRY
jgi:hypothetical protein